MATLQPSPQDPGPARRGRGWSIAFGLVLIVIGILALLMPAVAALATALTLGWQLAAGIVTLVLGACILFFPIAGIATLALWIGAFLFAGGIVRLVLAFRLKPAKGWEWVLLDAVVSIVVGVLIAWGWPASSIPFIGVLTGFWLLFSGIWRITLDARAPRDGGGGSLSPAT